MKPYSDSLYSRDRNHIFRDPVSKTQVPDYFDIIKNPMSWSVIEAKLDSHQYWSLQAFKVCRISYQMYAKSFTSLSQDDINLVLDNALLYNKPGTKFHQVAVRLKASSKQELDALDDLPVSHLDLAVDCKQSTEPMVDVDGDGDHEESTRAQSLLEASGSQGPSTPTPVRALMQQTASDLEPPLEVLNLLVSKEAIQDDLRLILDKDPLQSLFSFEWGEGRPLPPPLQPVPLPKLKQSSKSKVVKVKRDRKAENEKRKRQKEEAAAAAAAAAAQQEHVKGEGTEEAQVSVQIDNAVDGPRTRRAVAAAAETQDEMPPPGDVILAATNPVPRRGPGLGKRRMSAAHGEDPPMVDDVGSQESFKMFNEGWVLPAGQRRKGRPPPLMEGQIAPRPKKKSKMSAGVLLVTFHMILTWY